MLVLRQTKGSPLTIAEEDGNFVYLQGLFESINSGAFVKTDGTTPIFNTLGYNSLVTITNPTDLTHKQYVDDLFASIDISGLLPKSAGSGQALTGDLYAGSNNIRDVAAIYGTNGNQAIRISGTNRVLSDRNGNTVVDFSNQSNGLGITNGTAFSFIKSTTATNETFSLPDKGGSGGTIATLSDLSGLQPTITLTTSGSNGASTFLSNTLNIPTYTLAGLGGFSNPMTTAGDIIIGGSSGVPTRLSAGTNGFVLTISGGVPVWAAAGGTGTVTSVSVTTAAGVSGSVATATTTPAITITLGDITPNSVSATLKIAGNNFAETTSNIRAGVGSAYAGTNVRYTVYGVGAGATVGQDNAFYGYNVKGGTASGSFNNGFGNRINELNNNINSSTIIGINVQPYVGNVLWIVNNSAGTVNNIRTSGVYLGNTLSIPQTGTYSGSTGYGVIVGTSINDSNTTATAKRNILIGSSIDISGSNNSNEAVIISYSPTLSGAIQNSVGIGTSIQILNGEPNCTLVGGNAKSYVDPTYGTANGQQTGVGYMVITGAWRASSFGAFSQALAVSTTVTGFGGYANAPHASLSGRGGYNTIANAHLVYTGGGGGDKIYFGGIGSSWINPAMPGTETPDESIPLNAGTYYTRLYARPGVDLKPTPTLTNTRGAHFRIIGGLSTGTAVGGNIELAVSPASGSSSNTLNTEVVFVTIDAAAGVSIGMSTSQKVGHYGVTPIVQPTTGIASSSLTNSGLTTLMTTATFDGYTIAQVVKALRNLGLLA